MGRLTIDETADAVTYLTARLAEMRSHGAEAVWQFFQDLRSVEDDATIVAFLLVTLAALRTEDGALIPMAAAAELARRRRVEALPRLRQIAPRLPRIRGLRDYRADIALTIAILENAAAGSPCDCAVLASHRAPPAGRGDLVVEQEEALPDRTMNLTVRCRICGQGWWINVDESYHYPTYDWSRIRQTSGTQND